MRQWTLLALGIVFLWPAVWAGESIPYSITNKSTTVLATNRTSRIGYPVVEPKTDIFAIDPDIGKKRLTFSDANAAFLLLPWKSGGEIVTGGGRIFARWKPDTAANSCRL
jgi:hypothetical protein